MIKRIYAELITDHFSGNRQMVFLSGARQVGKTTAALAALPGARYFNYDNVDDAAVILGGVKSITADLNIQTPAKEQRKVIFDEIHKYPRWKNLLKGFFDSYGKGRNVIITGSARLAVYKRGGDSLAGRYFPFTVHPVSAREAVGAAVNLDSIFQKPARIPADVIETLLEFGGFPEPFLKANKRFYNNWQLTRRDQIFREDLRDLSRVQDVRQIEFLGELLAAQAGSQTVFANLANELRVKDDTIKAWITLLESLYVCFQIQPWSANVANSLRKQPKMYLWDWSKAADMGARRENFTASHLLKAVHWWNSCGLGDFGLYYLRDKQKHEVDFLVVRDKKPFMMVEVKSSSHHSISPNIEHFQKTLKAPHVFQLAFDMPVSGVNPSELKMPAIIAAADLFKTLV
jgi:predicted AAA+ superfamily ATPase